MPRSAAAQESISFIRDAETEGDIRLFVTPIFAAAGLDASAVHIYLVNDPRINSFVAGGQNVFINTGLLLRSENPNQVIGVIAHETGHIAGGHLLRSQEEMRNATIKGIIAMVLGAGAAAASHGEGVGGVLAGGAGVAQRSFLRLFGRAGVARPTRPRWASSTRRSNRRKASSISSASSRPRSFSRPCARIRTFAPTL